MNKKNETTVVLATVFVLGMASGYLSKAILDEDKINDLKNQLRSSKFKARINRRAFEAALKTVPAHRYTELRDQIKNDIEFEKITADQY